MIRKLRRTRGKPTEVDVHVGRMIRRRRQLLGLSQTNLADRLNVTFQQVQKYERGSNRVGAGRLYQLATVLDVPVGYFFEELPDQQNQILAEQSPALSREAARVLRAFESIENEDIKRRVRDLLEELGQKTP